VRGEAEYKGASEAVTVTVNGRTHAIEPGETVEALLDRLGIAARYALVERNGEPLERTRYGETALEDGDSLVVARPVAGG
jgi:thiamine biosynthesis protein ThiS